MRTIRTIVLGLVVALGVVLLLGGLVTSGLVKLPSMFQTEDRTGPSVLRSLTDLSDYHAASAHYETVVDLENDNRLLPSLISGERVLYVGKGNVDAIVDFGQLDERRVTVSPDRSSVSVDLPAPIVDTPVLDIENSYVASRDAGLITRFGGSDVEHQAQLKAVDQMTAAATGESSLTDLAKTNTTALLEGLFGSLGYTDVTVSFDQDLR